MAGSYVSGAGEALSRINAIKRANPDAGIMDYADEWTDLWLNVAGAVLGTSLSVKDVRAVRSAGKELDFAIDEMKASRTANRNQDILTDSARLIYCNDVDCCFVAGTMVSTIDGGTAIEDISAGDLVLAGNPVTGDVAYHKVLETYRNSADTLVHVTLENGEEIVTTLTHPFYVVGASWIAADRLDTSDRLLSADGAEIRIKDIWVEELEETVTVYNFQVEDYHTYYVGDTQILVHNTCSAGDVAGTIGDQESINSVPNPNGKKGGTAHQNTINSIKNTSINGKIQYESKYNTPNGYKQSRYADAVEIVDGEVTKIHQVGKVNKNGTPITRESKAIEDIMNSPDYNGAPIYFWSYNIPNMGPIIFD